MRDIDYPKDMLGLIGEEMGVSDWVTIDQDMIDKFADATGDHQWIHVDVERAKKEMPGGKTLPLPRSAHLRLLRLPSASR